MERRIFSVLENGFCRFANGSGAAGKTDVQHGAERQGASIFSVVETKPAVAVFPGVFVWASNSTAAFLSAAGQLFHDRLHAVEGGSIGKVHGVFSFS